MSDNALDAQGTKLSIVQAGSPVTLLAIPDIRDINFRTGSAAVNDTTDLDSTAREKRMGLPDEGQCTATIMIRPKNTAHAALIDARVARTKLQLEIEFTDESPATRYRFFGYVLAVPMSANTDSILESNLVIEITGLVEEVV
jgi:hypothetical protein